jgi:hypothetical protein
VGCQAPEYQARHLPIAKTRPQAHLSFQLSSTPALPAKVRALRWPQALHTVLRCASTCALFGSLQDCCPHVTDYRENMMYCRDMLIRALGVLAGLLCSFDVHATPSHLLLVLVAESATCCCREVWLSRLLVRQSACKADKLAPAWCMGVSVSNVTGECASAFTHLLTRGLYSRLCCFQAAPQQTLRS